MSTARQCENTPQAATQSAGLEGLLARVVNGVRHEIITGAIPPGTALDCQEIARRHGVTGTGHLVVSALARLRDEGIVFVYRHHRYAAPAGPPDPLAGARLGAELRRYRLQAGLTHDELAAVTPVLPRYWATCAAHRAEEIRAAEAGAWHERGFWAELDATVNASGDLLKLHDHMYAAPGS